MTYQGRRTRGFGEFCLTISIPEGLCVVGLPIFSVALLCGMYEVYASILAEHKPVFRDLTFSLD
jgi:hypothetical protein